MKSIDVKMRRFEQLEKKTMGLREEESRIKSEREKTDKSSRALAKEIGEDIFENLIFSERITEMTDKMIEELSQKYPGIDFSMQDFVKVISKFKEEGKVKAEAYIIHTDPEFGYLSQVDGSFEGWREEWEWYKKDVRSFRNINVL